MKTARTLCATIRGQVQGLGFRPYVYRLAVRYGVTGSVGNSSRGVEIIAQGPRARELLDRLAAEPPPLARITGMAVTARRLAQAADFRIVGSSGGAATGVDVLPDIATCADCAAEVADPANRRHRYPFTNCTQCGPRYTIIEDLPYDRPQTTMRRFEMCPDCRREYEDPADRRFHAQPNACPVCGPRLRLLDRGGRPVAGNPLDRAAAALARGRIVALKSLGGYQLACDARNSSAVARLRRRKRRPDKPLALMCPDLATVSKFCRVSRASRELLRSPAAPIVLL
ncbi:carbamoyltransferase HypF, partial [candidate division WOR-3 bacterium]|nr:carbamoyltransferase HypF [candidate division WOR-3 bacterium]